MRLFLFKNEAKDKPLIPDKVTKYDTKIEIQKINSIRMLLD